MPIAALHALPSRPRTSPVSWLVHIKVRQKRFVVKDELGYVPECSLAGTQVGGDSEHCSGSPQRIWCQGRESNARHRTFQARALPTELPWHTVFVERTARFRMCSKTCDALVTLATLMGLEPTTFAVTGRRSNQLSYSAKDRQAPTRRGGHGWARTSDPPRVKRMLSR